MSEASLRAGLHPSIVLSAYLEPLLRGRRVAVFGDATIGLADELSQRGARLVHVYDPDAARVSEALARAAPGRPHQVAYALLAGDMGVRDGAFDVIIVPDLALFPDPADAIRRARRLVPSSGVAVFVAPNPAASARSLLPVPDFSSTLVSPPIRPVPHVPQATTTAKGASLGYYELFDLVSLQFAKVRMIGQAPFVGYTVADFAPHGEPDVSVDTSLLASSEEPEHFIAVASDRPVALDAYAVVELPWHDVAETLAGNEIAAARPEDKRALAEAEARAARLTTELTSLREREASLARDAEGRAGEADALAARLAALGGEAEKRELRLREVEARAGDSHVRAERLANQIRDLEEELVRQRDRGTKLSKLLDDEKRARQKAELELGMVRGRPDIAGGKDRIDALAAELDAARARTIELEVELADARKRLVAPPDAKLLARLNELEQAVNAAMRESADAAAQRDVAKERASRAEARSDQLAAEAQRGASHREDMAGVHARAASLESKAAEAEARAAALALRLAEAERSLAAAEHLAAEREARIAEQDARLATTLSDLAAERTKIAAALDDRSAVEAAGVEISSLETALRDRGRMISTLTRDLRESERVGKELLSELESLRAWNTNGAPPSTSSGPASGEDLRTRLDALATTAARSEADLRAAGWRIAQLERELSAAQRNVTEPTVLQIELEQALAAARDEVAMLRRALGKAS